MAGVAVLVALACAPATAQGYDETANWLQSYGQTIDHMTDVDRSVATVLQTVKNVTDTVVYEADKIPRRGLEQFANWPWNGDPGCSGYRHQGTFAGRKQEVEIANAAGQTLAATVWAPSQAQLDAQGLSAPLPGVVYSPGVLSAQPMYCWFAAGMANNGYMVLTYDVTGQGKSDGAQRGNPVSELGSAIDWFVSPANPFAAELDLDRIGTAGHSMGAGAVQSVGSHGGIVKAISAMSDLDADYSADVPIQGQGADYETFILPTTPTPDSDPAGKLAGFEAARARGLDTQEVVIESASHLAWSHVTWAYTSTWSEEVALHYALAWFDRYLYGDMERAGATGTERLRENYDAGGGHGVSRKFRSAYSLDGGATECLDMVAGGC